MGMNPKEMDARIEVTRISKRARLIQQAKGNRLFRLFFVGLFLLPFYGFLYYFSHTHAINGEIVLLLLLLSMAVSAGCDITLEHRLTALIELIEQDKKGS